MSCRVEFRHLLHLYVLRSMIILYLSVCVVRTKKKENRIYVV